MKICTPAWPRAWTLACYSTSMADNPILHVCSAVAGSDSMCGLKDFVRGLFVLHGGIRSKLPGRPWQQPPRLGRWETAVVGQLPQLMGDWLVRNI